MNGFFPIEKSTQNFLSNCPELCYKYLYDLSKNHLRKFEVTEENKANIFRVTLEDPLEEITVVEYNRLHKCILAGTFKGLIYSWLLFEDGSEQDHKKFED